MRGRVAVVVGLATIAGACTIVNGLSVPSAMETPDAAVESGDETTPADPCPHAYPPARPAGTDTGGITFISAVHTVDLGARDSGIPEVVGFDLDKTCTCPAPETCKSPNPSTPPCDGDGGVDNAATGLFQTALSSGNLDLRDDVQSDLNAGSHGILFWVQDYNGEADDPLVRVALLVAAGLESGGKPTFEAGETWAVADTETTISSGNVVPVSLTQGYVTNHQLVVQGRFELPLLAGITVSLNQAFVVATIERNGSGDFFLSDGTLNGRAPLDAVIRSIGGVEKPRGSGKRLCDSDDPSLAVAFQALKGYVCGARDSMQNPAQDSTGASCDALSLGLRFTAVAAKVGSQRTLTSVTYCADAALDCPLQ